MGDRMEVSIVKSILTPWYADRHVFVGLLVSACINRATEGTFGCALAEVGVHDLLKVGDQILSWNSLTAFRFQFHRFTIGSKIFCTEFWMKHLTEHPDSIGKAWISDYGNPDDPKDFDYIFPLSPLHNIPKGKVLPPYMLLTADRMSPFYFFAHLISPPTWLTLQMTIASCQCIHSSWLQNSSTVSHPTQILCFFGLTRRQGMERASRCSKSAVSSISFFLSFEN